MLAVLRPRFEATIRRRYEFRERVNSSWKLVFDRRHDVSNQDIALANLDDIVLYVNHTYLTNRRACR